MNFRKNNYFYIIILIFILSLQLYGSTKESIRRLAFIAGANNGGAKREKLQYAVTDAVSVRKVLHEMGGVLPGDSYLLIEPDREKFFSGMKSFQQKINSLKSKSARIEVIFYYSGHSDEEGILLGNESIRYKELKNYISSLDADVRIAIFDSCSSGAFTRLKGGKMRIPFMIDSSNDMKGYAFMTSSAVDETSQESDTIKGSFFTHYLLSGLRGAADMTQDGRITLNEAYQFAYNETLARTEKTLSGPQHPNYNIQMSGTGDVVITDIRESRVIMTLDEELSGRFFIRDKESNLVCELRKPAGRQIQFGLEDGTYTISNIRDNAVYEARIVLVTGNIFTLSQDHFNLTKKETTVPRGNIQQTEQNYETKTWAFSLYPDVRRNRNTIHKYIFNLAGSYSARLDGISFGFGPGIVSENVTGFQIDLCGNYAKTGVEGAQIFSIGNYSGGKVTGGQLFSLFNISRGDLTGAQVSVLFNYGSSKTEGLQSSYIFNISRQDMTGCQITGLFNYSSVNQYGTQISGLFNYTGKEMTGLQISGITNISGNTKGSQISLLNIADDFSGVQLGLVNIAKNQKGIPIGLINISENGGIEFAVWGSNLMACNTGIIFRSNYIFTTLSAGWMNLEKDHNDSFAYGFHLGGHFPLGIFYSETEAGFIHIDNKKIFSNNEYKDQHVIQAKVTIGYNIFKHISIFTGGGLNYIYDAELYSKKYKTEFKEGYFSPVYFAGLKILLYGEGN